MFDVITIGAATRDVFLKSKNFKVEKNLKSPTKKAEWFPLGSKIDVEKIIFETGGGATNAAVTFARQGLKSAVVARIGDDPGGRIIIENLEKEGINTHLIKKDPENYTAYSIILVAENGDRTILVYRGASAHFSEHDIPWEKLETKWIFVTNLAGNVSLLKKIVDYFHDKYVKVALVPGGAELKKGSKILGPIFSKADVVIMNREEASGLTGIKYEDKERIVKKTCLLTKHIGVVTDAAVGATACDSNHIYHIGTHGNEPVDRTGAGDAFAAGFIAGLIKYESVEGALELAADNASSVVSYFGAKAGIIRDNKSPFKEKLKVHVTKIK